MKPFRILMAALVAVFMCVFPASILVGCSTGVRDVTATRMEYERQAPDGAKVRFRLWSPKEVEIGGATIDPVNNLVTFTNYSASPSAAALRAQVDERREMREMLRDGLREGLAPLKDLAPLAGYFTTGKPPPATATGPLSPEAVAQIVAAMRASGLKVAPVDDPSTPKPEVNP